MYVIRNVWLTQYPGRCFWNSSWEIYNSACYRTCDVYGRTSQISNHINSILTKTYGLIDRIVCICIQPVIDSWKRTCDTVHLCHKIIGRDVSITVQKFIHLFRQLTYLCRQKNDIAYYSCDKIFRLGHQWNELHSLGGNCHCLDTLSHSCINNFHILTPFILHKQLILCIVNNQCVVCIINNILTQYELV